MTKVPFQCPDCNSGIPITNIEYCYDKTYDGEDYVDYIVRCDGCGLYILEGIIVGEIYDVDDLIEKIKHDKAIQ